MSSVSLARWWLGFEFLDHWVPTSVQCFLYPEFNGCVVLIQPPTWKQFSIRVLNDWGGVSGSGRQH